MSLPKSKEGLGALDETVVKLRRRLKDLERQMEALRRKTVGALRQRAGARGAKRKKSGVKKGATKSRTVGRHKARG